MADNRMELKCPACQHDMIKVFIPETGFNVDVCANGCGGIYFDNREFKHFDEPYENIDDISKALDNKNFIAVNENLPRYCPVCGAKMVKNYSSMRKEVQVDECYSCGGKFLDYGELEKIRAEFNTEAERIADTMAYLYNTVGFEIKQQQEALKEARSKRSPLKKLFDKLIYG